MDRLKYFKSEFNTRGRREEIMMLRRWAVLEHFVYGAYVSPEVLVRLFSNFSHNTSRGSSCAFRGI